MTVTESAHVSDELDLMSMLDLLLKSKRLIALTLAIGLLFGALLLVAMPPIYRADVTIQIEDSTDLASSAVNNVLSGLSSLFDIKSTDDGEMEILRSRLVTESALDDLKLYIDVRPKRFPLFGGWIARHIHQSWAPGVLGFGGYAWGNESLHVARFDVPIDDEDDSFKVRITGPDSYRLIGSDLAHDVDGKLGREVVAATDLGDITILVTGFDARIGTEFRLRRHSRSQTLKKLRDDLVITEKGKDQSGVIGVTYDDADSALATAVLNEIATSYVKQNQQRKVATADQSLQFLKSQLPGIRHDLEVAEDRLTAYQNRYGVVDISEQTKAVLDQVVQTQASLFDLKRKRTELLATLSPRHPAVLALDRQIDAAQDLIGEFDRKLDKVPNNQKGLVRLTRDVRVQTQLYVGLLNSVQQLELARAGGIGNVRVIDHAIVTDEPVRPKPLIVLPIAGLAGLFVGIVIAITRVAMAGRITDPREIERKALLEVVAAVPVSEAERELSRISARGVSGPDVLAIRAPRDSAVQALRNLRVAVQFALAETEGSKLLLVTGPTEGIGKSFTSANLAVLLGLADRRVLLVDGDLRKGRLKAVFQRFGSVAGLSDVLHGTASVEAAIVRSVSPNVDLLATGPLVPHPDELFEKAKVTDLLRGIAVQYDIVVIDSPPVLPVSDTTILAPIAHLVLLVTKSGVTTRGEILESIRRLQRAGAVVRHVVFNGFRAGLRSQQDGYGNYYTPESYGNDGRSSQGGFKRRGSRNA